MTLGGLDLHFSFFVVFIAGNGSWQRLILIFSTMHGVSIICCLVLLVLRLILSGPWIDRSGCYLLYLGPNLPIYSRGPICYASFILLQLISLHCIAFKHKDSWFCFVLFCLHRWRRCWIGDGWMESRFYILIHYFHTILFGLY